MIYRTLRKDDPKDVRVVACILDVLAGIGRKMNGTQK